LLAYRSCKRTELTLTAGVTTLIGPNGSGKTNILQGILLLNVSRRRRFRDDDELYTSRCRIDADFVVKRKKVRYRASITYRPTEAARDEVVISDERWNLKDVTGDSKWIPQDEIEQFQRGLRGHHYISIGGRIRALSFDEWISRHPKKIPPEAIRAVEAVVKLRSAITYYSASQFTNPSLCPTSFDIEETGELRSDVIATRRPAHTRFLYELYNLASNNRAAYDTFISLVDKRGVGLIDKIKWRDVKFSSPAYEVRSGGSVITRRRNRIMVIPTVHVGSAQLSFNQLSEGTLRTLALLFYVTTDKSELLLIEEPEVCVHHGLLKSVIEIIKEFGKSKQIIFSTHSEVVVDNLSPEQLLLVRRQEDSGTTVVPISKAMSNTGYAALKKYLAVTGSLGEFWRHSGFSQ
jgi:ABC-type cobalamin/Fe3+-siderophores transport system ATPase subunit